MKARCATTSPCSLESLSPPSPALPDDELRRPNDPTGALRRRVAAHQTLAPDHRRALTARVCHAPGRRRRHGCAASPARCSRAARGQAPARLHSTHASRARRLALLLRPLPPPGLFCIPLFPLLWRCAGVLPIFSVMVLMMVYSTGAAPPSLALRSSLPLAVRVPAAHHTACRRPLCAARPRRSHHQLSSSLCFRSRGTSSRDSSPRSPSSPSTSSASALSARVPSSPLLSAFHLLWWLRLGGRRGHRGSPPFAVVPLCAQITSR